MSILYNIECTYIDWESLAKTFGSATVATLRCSEQSGQSHDTYVLWSEDTSCIIVKTALQGSLLWWMSTRIPQH